VYQLAKGWTAGFRFPVGARFFSSLLFSTASTPGLKSNQPPIQWVLVAISPGVKRPEREADHLLPSTAEVKNSGAQGEIYHQLYDKQSFL
jgi:hypothetical protein